MGERWTLETEELVARATGAHYLRMDQIDADGNSPCVCGQWAENATDIGWDDHMAEVTLTALADAGQLVTVEMTAVQKAAADLVDDWKAGRSTHGAHLVAAVVGAGLWPPKTSEPAGPQHPAQQFDGGVDGG